ncbi:MAG: PTS glucose transporter subunit IIA [Oscillospiraceae bacterium]|nr:PTS glucose transporter subunit IIA [Oscillospiraceae bacterium]
MLGFTRKRIVIAAPMDGIVIPITEVDDPVFSEEVLGRGVAIKPSSGCVRAPAKAAISMMFETGHAVSIITDSGVELLIHVGLDTVKLKGKHYTKLKESDENVNMGDALIVFDTSAITAEGYDTMTPIVVCNPDAFSEISFAKKGIIHAGDPLITLKA